MFSDVFTPVIAIVLAEAGVPVVLHGQQNVPTKFGITPADLLNGLGIQSALFVDGPNQNLKLGVRNLQKTQWVDSAVVNAYDVLSHSMIVMSEAAVLQLQKRLLLEELT